MLAMMLAQYDRGAEVAGAGIFAAIWACWCAVAIIFLLLLAFWIWMLIDCIIREEEEFPEGQTKTMWLLILIITWVVGFHWLAAIFYYFMVYKKTPRAKSA